MHCITVSRLQLQLQLARHTHIKCWLSGRVTITRHCTYSQSQKYIICVCFSLKPCRLNISFACCSDVSLFRKRTPESESDIQPSMVTYTRNSCSAFTHPIAHAHCEHTHTVNTYPKQWAAIYAAAPGEQLGVRCLACLAQGHLVLVLKVHSHPPPTIPTGPRLELATFRLGVRLSTIRPRLTWQMRAQVTLKAGLTAHDYLVILVIVRLH